jgi:hypothetical protein
MGLWTGVWIGCQSGWVGEGFNFKGWNVQEKFLFFLDISNFEDKSNILPQNAQNQTSSNKMSYPRRTQNSFPAMCTKFKTQRVLTFTWPTFMYANARKKTTRNSFHIFRQQGNFTALLRHAVLFSKKCHIFHNTIFLCSNNTHVFYKPCVKI